MLGGKTGIDKTMVHASPLCHVSMMTGPAIAANIPRVPNPRFEVL